MDNATKEVFKKISDDLQFMYIRWQTYVEIYGTCGYNAELLNKTSSTFFLYFEVILYKDIILSLSKLVDPANMHGHDIASFPYLIKKIENQDNDELIEKLNLQLDSIKSNCHKIIEMRNKYVAHNELGFDAKFPPRQEIDIAFKLVGDFMRLIYQYFEGCHFDYEGIVHEGGSSLLLCLHKAIEYDNLVCEHKKPDWELMKDFIDKQNKTKG